MSSCILRSGDTYGKRGTLHPQLVNLANVLIPSFISLLNSLDTKPRPNKLSVTWSVLHCKAVHSKSSTCRARACSGIIPSSRRADPHQKLKCRLLRSTYFAFVRPAEMRRPSLMLITFTSDKDVHNIMTVPTCKTTAGMKITAAFLVRHSAQGNASHVALACCSVSAVAAGAQRA